jgi:hypothetical protein
MRRLVRRTTPVVILLSLATVGCSGDKPGTAPATPAPSTSGPSGTPPTPTATPTPTVNYSVQARTLVVKATDVGPGYKAETITFGPLESVEGNKKFCTDTPLPSDPQRLLLLFTPVTKRGSDFADVRHELRYYAAGGAAKAFAELDRGLRRCKRVKLRDGSIWSLTRFGPGRGRIVIHLPGYVDSHATFRVVRAGEYLSMLTAYGDSAASADRLAAKLEATVGRRFAKADVR